jgi:hypothetical protein
MTAEVANWIEKMEKRSRRRICDLVALPASQGLSQNRSDARRVHDGQEHQCSIHGLDTEAQDLSPSLLTSSSQHTAGPYRSAVEAT